MFRDTRAGKLAATMLPEEMLKQAIKSIKLLDAEHEACRQYAALVSLSSLFTGRKTLFMDANDEGKQVSFTLITEEGDTFTAGDVFQLVKQLHARTLAAARESDAHTGAEDRADEVGPEDPSPGTGRSTDHP